MFKIELPARKHRRELLPQQMRRIMVDEGGLDVKGKKMKFIRTLTGRNNNMWVGVDCPSCKKKSCAFPMHWSVDKNIRIKVCRSCNTITVIGMVDK